MLARRLSSRTYGLVLALQIVAGAIAAVVAAVLKADATSVAGYSPVASKGILQVQNAAWWILPVALILSGSLAFVRKLIGPPWLWNTVHSYLDVFRAEAFNMGPEDANHHHRVTLFRYTDWCWTLRMWPWTGWLVARERSGHTTQSGISYFRAPDDADGAEGIAGMAWARNREVGISNLPDLTNKPAPEDFRTYARATGVSEKTLRRKIPKARSLYGIPVEVKGKVWGVIVLDSRSPNGIGDVQTAYRALGKFLPKLLERV